MDPLADVPDAGIGSTPTSIDTYVGRAEMVATQTRSTWLTLAWVGGVVATLLNGVVVGYGAIWFQLFGDSADAEDCRVSAGGYGAAAVVLALAVPAVVAHRAPRWLAWPTAASAAVLGLLAANSAAAAVHAEPVSAPINTGWDGVGGVLWAPWTWALIALGVHGLYRLASARRTPTRTRLSESPPD